MRLQHVIAISCLSIFLVIGVAFMALGLRNVWRGLVSTRWPTVIGSVSDSRVDVQTGTDRQTNAPSVTYVAEITVDYRVDGRDYTTGTLAFGQTVGSGDSSEAELRRLRYPPGMPVSVSYDPSDPAVAVLRPGFDPEVLWLPGAGLGFFLPGLMFLLAYLSMAMNLPVMGVAWRLFGTIFALIGIAMLSVGVLNLSRARASLAWPVTRGVIFYGHRDSSTSVTRTEDGRSYRSTSEGTHLVYSYDADGTTRFSNIRRFGQISGASGDWASRIAERYPLGAEVEVAYDPEDPDRAVLEPGIGSEACWLPGAGVAFLLFGLVALLWSPRW